MYKLLIVDDEPLVTIVLQSMIPWQELNVTICGNAGNGKQALEMIQALHPDIVITDIKMPVMNGLELIETCQSVLTTVPEFIILTCYEDFPYVKAALKCHAVDYIIKLGIKPEELRSSLKRALKNVQRKQATEVSSERHTTLDMDNYKDKFILKLLNNLFESTEQFALQAKELQISFSGDYYIAAACSITITPVSDHNNQYLTLYNNTLSMLHNILSKYITFYLVSLDIGHFYLIFELKKTSSYFNSERLLSLLKETFQMIENYFNVTVLCALGDYKKEIQLISESYQEARQIQSLCSAANPLLFFPQCSSVEISTPKNAFDLTILKEDIQKAFSEYDMISFQSITQSITDLFQGNPSNYIQAMDVTSSMLHLCLIMIPEIEPFLSEKFSAHHKSYLSLYNQKSTQQVMDWLNRFSRYVIEFYQNQSKMLKNTLVNNVQQYIDDHVKEKLVLNDVAAIFSISPNYLGHLFKKYTALGFNEYVTHAKISRSKYLMFHTDLKLYEIATELGFENPFYFSRVFKKIEGCSPRQYILNQHTERLSNSSKDNFDSFP